MLSLGVQPDYFLYKMEMFELFTLLDSYESEQRSWEQTRRIVWAIFQSQSSKNVDIEQIWPFPWDKEGVNTESTNKEELDYLKEKAYLLENKLNNNK